MDDLADRLSEAWKADSDLDMDNDLHYLLGLAGEAMKDEDDEFDSDAERAEWVVSHWCQELQYVPDLSEYAVGDEVPMGEPPEGQVLSDVRE